MTKLQLISKLNELLEAYQFFKCGEIWNRQYPNFVDVLDLQISKSKDAFTINVGVASKFVIDACWGLVGFDVVEESKCTVRTRLSELLHGRDVWWSLKDDDSINDALIGIENAVQFLQYNHSVDHMIETLQNDPASKRYPPGIIYLALLQYEKGEFSLCRQMFEDMKLTGAWRQKSSEILAKLMGE